MKHKQILLTTNDYDKTLIINSKTQYCLFNKDVLIDQFLLNKVPIGILLDYIEENPHVVFNKFVITNQPALIEEMRTYFTDLTKLYRDC